ncbi:MAG: DNA repair protein RadC [Clostridiales bacterium]|nr:DNA repair protein RadC [Clostridiales bacterium]MDY3746896.1 DNA repair protein RadC [Lachnospiraceae bacterium]
MNAKELMMDNSILQIKNMPESERPYEKCLKLGVSSLSDAELLAVIIKTGTKNMRSTDLASHILNLCEKKGGIGFLSRLSIHELTKIKGIGKVKAIQIVCAAELSKRIAKSSASQDISFTSPEAVASFYMEDLRHFTQEHLILLMLDTKNRRIKDILITKGTINSTIMHPREIFIEALKHEAVNIILVHNHPSGDPTPSKADIQMTRQVAKIGDMIGIPLIDHVIIGDNIYESLSCYISDER